MKRRLVRFAGIMIVMVVVLLGYKILTTPEPGPVPPIPAAKVSAPAVETSGNPVLLIEVAGVSNGIVELELLPEIAPGHVERILTLVENGAYDGVVFHRVIDGFMAQTGDVQFGKKDGGQLARAGTGGSDLPNLQAEFSKLPYIKGVVGMARSQNPNSANSQFFIMFNSAASLNGQYTVVGRVLAGQDVVDTIKRGEGRNGEVTQPDYMKSVTLKAD